ncbi:DMT family transporter [Elongatibacter sediminis]|uniref:DMT family transporter n=1 Tax=Elongatibacter sediminis TaxID=3119006 RepID=A0AAW9R9A6_9GAMM
MPARDLILVLIVCVAWGFNFIAVAQGMTHFSPYVFTVLRFSLLLGLLLPFLKLPPTGQWPRLVAVCLSTGALHFGFLFWAMGRSADVTSVAITLQTYVPMTVLMAIALLGERVGWRTGVAIGVSFAGVAMLSLDPLIFEQVDVVGIALLAAFFQSLGSVLMRGLRGLGVLNFQAWTAAISLPPLILGSLLFDDHRVAMVLSAGPLDWGAVVYTTVFASILGHGLFFYLVQRHPVSAVMPYILLAPVLAVIFGIVVWGDRPGWRLLAGGALVLSGILVVSIRALRRREKRRSD